MSYLRFEDQASSILNPAFTQVGIGAVSLDGDLWLTEDSPADLSLQFRLLPLTAPRVMSYVLRTAFDHAE
jgi:hypothetical protein